MKRMQQIFLNKIEKIKKDYMRLLALILIIGGISIISISLIIRYEGYRKQKAMIEAFEQNNTKNQLVIRKEEGKALQKPPSVEMEGAIGIIVIPKIDLKVAIGEGVDDQTLKFAVGHFKGTAMPGEKGNFCIAGHRSYTYNEFFNRLDELGIGDKIIIRTKKGEFSYKIYEKVVVEPSDISVLNPSNESIITMVTCTPIRVATHRLIIKGKLE